MAEINLGTFPYYGGQSIYDQSMYIGNNRFLRVASQINNDATVGVIYDSTNVFNATATVTQVCSEILLESKAMTNFKMCTLGNGNFCLIGRISGTSYEHILVFSYDNINNTFNIIHNESLNSITQYFDSHNGVYTLSIVPYENSKVVVCAVDAHSGAAVVVFDTSGVSVTNSVAFSNSNSIIYDGSRAYAESHVVNIVDDILYWVSTRYGSGYQSVIDLSTNTEIISTSTLIYNVAKLTDGKYIAIKENGYTGQILYSLANTISNPTPSDFGTFSEHTPVFRISSSSNSYRGRAIEVFSLDEFHYIVFYKESINHGTPVSTNLYAKVVNVLDDQYAFISDNSTSDVVVTSTLNTQSLLHNNGKLVNRLDPTSFYIKSNDNTFEFFQIAV